MTPAEIAELRRHVQSVKCTGCGAAVDVREHSACTFCRAPIATIDPDQLQRTIAALQEKETLRPKPLPGKGPRQVDPALPLRLATQRLRGERVFADLGRHNQSYARRGPLRLGPGRDWPVVYRVDPRRSRRRLLTAAAFHDGRSPSAAATLVRLDTGAPIRLRGVNRSGLEYADPGPAGRGAAAFLDSVAFDEADLRRIAAWGANVVRVPFTQEFVLGGRGAATGADYLAALDQVVTWAEACRRLHPARPAVDRRRYRRTASARTGQLTGCPRSRTANPSSCAILASHYRDRPSVLFDLFNEPHTPMQADDAPLVGIRPDGGLWRLPARVVGMDEWQPWALRLVAEIRDAHPTSVIFVSGVRWAYDLRGFPLRRRSGHAGRGPRLQHARLPVDDDRAVAGPSPGAGVAPGLRPPGRGVSGLRGGVGRRAVRRRLGPPAARLSRGDDGGLDGVELVRLAAAAGATIEAATARRRPSGSW